MVVIDERRDCHDTLTIFLRQPERCEASGYKKPTEAETQQALAELRTPNCGQPQSSTEKRCCKNPNNCLAHGFTQPDPASVQANASEPVQAERKELRTPNCKSPSDMEEWMCCNDRDGEEVRAKTCAHYGFKSP